MNRNSSELLQSAYREAGIGFDWGRFGSDTMQVINTCIRNPRLVLPILGLMVPMIAAACDTEAPVTAQPTPVVETVESPEVIETPVVFPTPTYSAEGEPAGNFATKIESIKSIDPYDQEHKKSGADVLAQTVRKWIVEDFGLDAKVRVSFAEVSGLVNGAEVGGGLIAIFEKNGMVFMMTSYDAENNQPGYLGVNANPYKYSILSPVEEGSSQIKMTMLTGEGEWTVFEADGNTLTGFLPFGQDEWLAGVNPSNLKIQAAPTSLPEDVKSLLEQGGRFDPINVAYLDKDGKVIYELKDGEVVPIETAPEVIAPETLELKLNDGTTAEVPVIRLEEKMTEEELTLQVMDYISKDVLWKNGTMAERMKAMGEFFNPNTTVGDSFLPLLKNLSEWKGLDGVNTALPLSEVVDDGKQPPRDYFAIAIRQLENEQLTGTFLVYQDAEGNDKILFVEVDYYTFVNTAKNEFHGAPPAAATATP